MPSSKGSSQPRDGTRVSGIAGGFFTTKPSGKPQDSAFPHINNCLCNSKLYPAVSLSKQMGNSLSAIVIIMQTVLHILVSFFLCSVGNTGASSRGVTNATQLKHLQNVFISLMRLLFSFLFPPPLQEPPRGHP